MFLRRTKDVRYLIVITSIILSSICAKAAEVADATGRTIKIPDKVERIMAAGPPASRTGRREIR